MSPTKKRNTGHSVFQRLLNHARAHGEDFNLLLFRYGVERLLYRLSISDHADRFVMTHGTNRRDNQKMINPNYTASQGLAGMLIPNEITRAPFHNGPG